MPQGHIMVWNPLIVQIGCFSLPLPESSRTQLTLLGLIGITFLISKSDPVCTAGVSNSFQVGARYCALWMKAGQTIKNHQGGRYGRRGCTECVVKLLKYTQYFKRHRRKKNNRQWMPVKSLVSLQTGSSHLSKGANTREPSKLCSPHGSNWNNVCLCPTSLEPNCVYR